MDEGIPEECSELNPDDIIPLGKEIGSGMTFKPVQGQNNCENVRKQRLLGRYCNRRLFDNPFLLCTRVTNLRLSVSGSFGRVYLADYLGTEVHPAVVQILCHVSLLLSDRC